MESAPCRDKKTLVKVEYEWIHEYSIEYGDRLMNKNGVQKRVTKKIQYEAEIESETALLERIQKLGITLRIKDDAINKFSYYDGIVDGKRYKTKARYNKTTKEEAMSKLTNKQKQLIDELTIYFH